MKQSWPLSLIALCALAVALAFPGSARAGESYYLLMFSSQRPNYSPNYAHSFATFVKVYWPGNGPCPGDALMESHTISWLPADLDIRCTRFLPQSGRNFGLHETIAYARAGCQQVSLWGPYPIDRELYCLALKQIDHLNSGWVRYKANDTGHRLKHVSNCIHAVSETVTGLPVCVGSPGWGDTASYVVLRRMRPWVLDECHPQYWVSSALGLDRYPIIYRQGRPIGTGLVLGPLNSALGRDRDLIPRYGPPR